MPKTKKLAPKNIKQTFRGRQEPLPGMPAEWNGVMSRILPRDVIDKHTLLCASLAVLTSARAGMLGGEPSHLRQEPLVPVLDEEIKATVAAIAELRADLMKVEKTPTYAEKDPSYLAELAEKARVSNGT